MPDPAKMASTPIENKDMAPSEWEEKHGSKLWRKTKEAPFVPIGIAGLIAACATGAYKYKTRGNMSTSVYLMQLRVIAQGMVVGAITLGIGYSIVSDYYKKNSSPSSNK